MPAGGAARQTERRKGIDSQRSPRAQQSGANRGVDGVGIPLPLLVGSFQADEQTRLDEPSKNLAEIAPAIFIISIHLLAGLLETELQRICRDWTQEEPKPVEERLDEVVTPLFIAIHPIDQQLEHGMKAIVAQTSGQLPVQQAESFDLELQVLSGQMETIGVALQQRAERRTAPLFLLFFGPTRGAEVLNRVTEILGGDTLRVQNPNRSPWLDLIQVRRSQP